MLSGGSPAGPPCECCSGAGQGAAASAAVFEVVAATAGLAAADLMRAVGLVVYVAANHSVVAGYYFVPVPSTAGYSRQFAASVVHPLALVDQIDTVSGLYIVARELRTGTR